MGSWCSHQHSWISTSRSPHHKTRRIRNHILETRFLQDALLNVINSTNKWFDHIFPHHRCTNQDRRTSSWGMFTNGIIMTYLCWWNVARHEPMSWRSRSPTQLKIFIFMMRIAKNYKSRACTLSTKTEIGAIVILCAIATDYVYLVNLFNSRKISCQCGLIRNLLPRWDEFSFNAGCDMATWIIKYFNKCTVLWKEAR